jgi:phosphoribosyl-ATP pyrophosphohydrolase/phosphoribosyl-AMP cyclohydrolase
MSLTDEVRFDPETGLVPAVVQSSEDGRVLMLAYMNAEALRRTLEEGRVTFWSRSRGELWRKGDTSGHWLEVREVRLDCDGDALLVRARPQGPTCHTGEESCFDAGPRAVALARADAGGPAEEDGGAGDEPVRDGNVAGGGAERPTRRGAEVGAEPPGPHRAHPSPAPVLASVLEELVRVVAERDRDRPEGSYTTRLLEAGPALTARKVGEEAVEVALAAVDEPERLAEESADLLYHLVALWRAVGLPPDAVGEELSRRRGAGPTTSSGPDQDPAEGER